MSDKVIIIVNNDLHMSKGKIASQSAHAILAMYRFVKSNNINIKNWENSGEKIVVLKSTQKELDSILNEYSSNIEFNNRLNFFPIYDAGKTEVEPNSLTIIASTPITNNKIPDWINKLKLL
jgi:PTH2 family peptidyl-tRNA hydrolase